MDAQYLVYIVVNTYFLAMFSAVRGAAVVVPKWIDLSYPFRENETIYWPGQTKYTHTLRFSGDVPGTNVFVSYSDYGAGEHGGTHMDAPIHFIRGGKTLDQVPLDSVIGDAIVVNVSAKVDKDPIYQMTVEDLKDWEKEHGRIPDDSIVLMYTGRGKYWPDEKKYFGSNDTTNASSFNFPGMHPDAAQWLVDNKRIKMFGLDTPSFDHSKTKDYQTHRILLGRNIPGVENVANLHLLPPKGAEVFAAHMKIVEGSGGPCRMFARIVDKTEVNGAFGVAYLSSSLAVLLAIVYLFL